MPSTQSLVLINLLQPIITVPAKLDTDQTVATGDVRDFLAKYAPDTVVMDPQELDEAIVALVFLGREGKPTACYCLNKLATQFLKLNPEWTLEDAHEWIDYNCCTGLWIYKQDVRLSRLNHIKFSVS